LLETSSKFTNCSISLSVVWGNASGFTFYVVTIQMSRHHMNKLGGLGLVRVFTLGISIFLGLFVYMSIIASLGLIGGKFTGLSFEGWLWVLLALIGFFVCLNMSSPKKYMWYTANAFWLAASVLFVYLGLAWGISQGNWEKIGYVLYSLPLAGTVGCIVYFQSRQIKNYFHIIENHVEG
jgi:hypothetical protein